MQELVLKDSEFQKFSRYIYDTCGINLHDGKRELIKARLGRILRQRNFHSFGEYFNHIVNDRSGYELIVLLDSISTNLTYFFREPQHFNFLRTKVLPEIMNNKLSSRNNNLMFWSAGCSSGEEAYSIAIAVSEAFDNIKNWQIKILATDLSTRVLETAIDAVYEEKQLNNIPCELKRKYFQKGDKRWKGYFRVKKEVRKKVSFQRLNFMENFQFREPFHVIFCRNVMIYFDDPTKQVLVKKFYQHLADRGYLFIGHAESFIGLKHSFKYIQPSIYQRI